MPDQGSLFRPEPYGTEKPAVNPSGAAGGAILGKASGTPRRGSSPVPGAPQHQLSIDERFEIFDRDNPRVYELFRQYAREARTVGHTRYSADTICHLIRWDKTVRTTGDREFKINDHFTSRYARKLEREHPEEFGDFFEKRRLKGGEQ